MEKVTIYYIIFVFVERGMDQMGRRNVVMLICKNELLQIGKSNEKRKDKERRK